MEQQGPSRMAIWTAISRAAHLMLDSNPKIFVDPFARAFAGYSNDDDLLRALDSLELAVTPEGRARFATRHRYVEDELDKALDRGVTQYVILGAGLDSFAYRRTDLMVALDVFEIDRPASQVWKRARIAELGIVPPQRLNHIVIDFEHQTLGQGLADGGVDLSAPTYLSCLGVAQYLTAEALRKMLCDAAKVTAPGSELIVQFIPPLATLSTDDAGYIIKIADYAAAVGEPWHSFFTPEELDDYFIEAGFCTITHFDGEQANERYLQDRTDGLRLSASFHMVSGRVA
jgi:methyltransferase (TIGR00027 family)